MAHALWRARSQKGSRFRARTAAARKSVKGLWGCGGGGAARQSSVARKQAQRAVFLSGTPADGAHGGRPPTHRISLAGRSRTSLHKIWRNPRGSSGGRSAPHCRGCCGVERFWWCGVGFQNDGGLDGLWGALEWVRGVDWRARRAAVGGLTRSSGLAPERRSATY
jgi:hypothetical protein